MYIEDLKRKQFNELALKFAQANTEEKLNSVAVIDFSRNGDYAKMMVKTKNNGPAGFESYEMNDYTCCLGKEISENHTKIFREYLTEVYGNKYVEDAKAYDEKLEAARNYEI